MEAVLAQEFREALKDFETFRLVHDETEPLLYKFPNNRGMRIYGHAYIGNTTARSIKFNSDSVSWVRDYEYYDVNIHVTTEEDISKVITDMLNIQKLPKLIVPKGHIFIENNTWNTIESVCSLPCSSNHEFKKLTLSYISFVADKALNSKEHSPITMNSEGTLSLGSTGQTVKLGKVLGQLYPERDSTWIEQKITRWKSAFMVDTSRVEVSDDIAYVYNISSVGGSCMYDKGHFMELYEHLYCSIAYITDANNNLEARCLLWNNNIYLDNDPDNKAKAFDRIFYNTENAKITLTKWAEENGYTDIGDLTADYQLKTSKAFNSMRYMPYVDTMATVIESSISSEGSYQLASDCMNCDRYVDALTSTDGSSEDNSGVSEHEQGIWCVDVAEYRYEDDTYYCQTDHEHYAFDSDLVYINYSYYHVEDENITIPQDSDDYYLTNDCYGDGYGDYWVSEDRAIEYHNEDEY